MASRPIEQHLAEYVLGLVRTDGWRRYVQQCLKQWEADYGQQVTERVRAIINAQMRDTTSERR
jgi:hypothetical protein